MIDDKILQILEEIRRTQQLIIERQMKTELDVENIKYLIEKNKKHYKLSLIVLRFFLILSSTFVITYFLISK